MMWDKAESKLSVLKINCLVVIKRSWSEQQTPVARFDKLMLFTGYLLVNCKEKVTFYSKSIKAIWAQLGITNSFFFRSVATTCFGNVISNERSVQTTSPWSPSPKVGATSSSVSSTRCPRSRSRLSNSTKTKSSMSHFRTTETRSFLAQRYPCFLKPCRHPGGSFHFFEIMLHLSHAKQMNSQPVHLWHELILFTQITRRQVDF